MDKLKQAQKDGIVVGLKDLGVKPRLEIDEVLLHQPDGFNLFLLALDELQKAGNSKDIMSYYQVAGIHGLPQQFWDNVQSPVKVQSNEYRGGYCDHARSTFPSWHRPYIAMMEQTIYSKMYEFAEKFPDAVKSKYLEALKDFRLPYWDYYKARAHAAVSMPGVISDDGTTTFSYDFSMPQIFTVEQVMVRRPIDDQLHAIRNPLFQFSFPATGGLSTNDWRLAGNKSHSVTVRTPVSVGSSKPDTLSMNRSLNRQREPETVAMLTLLLNPKYNDYRSFASTAVNNQQAAGSLEDIHNLYHGMIGGSGHMGSPTVAAFDPVFWSHHCQIDRWLAIWQAIHPDKWYNDGEAAQLKQDAMPFRWQTKEKYWNADLCRSPETMGSFYQDSRGSPSEVTQRMIDLYGWSVRQGNQTQFGTPPASMKPLDVSKAQVFQYTSETHKPASDMLHAAMQVPLKLASLATSKLAHVGHSNGHDFSNGSKAENSASNGSRQRSIITDSIPSQQVIQGDTHQSTITREWEINRTVEKLALNGPFTIYFFLGTHDKSNPGGFKSEPNMVGIDHIFTSPIEACPNCEDQAGSKQLVTGCIILTPMLRDFIAIGQLASLDPKDIIPFLIGRLKWRIVTHDGESIDPRGVAGLKLMVSCDRYEGMPYISPATQEDYPEVIEAILGKAD